MLMKHSCNIKLFSQLINIYSNSHQISQTFAECKIFLFISLPFINNLVTNLLIIFTRLQVNMIHLLT